MKHGNHLQGNNGSRHSRGQREAAESGEMPQPALNTWGWGMRGKKIYSISTQTGSKEPYIVSSNSFAISPPAVGDINTKLAGTAHSTIKNRKR